MVSFKKLKQKGIAPLVIILGVLVILGIAGGAYYLSKTQIPKPQPQNPMVTSQTPQPTASSQITQLLPQTQRKLLIGKLIQIQDLVTL